MENRPIASTPKTPPASPAPLALPAFAFVLGAGLASFAAQLSLPLLAILAALGAALRRREGFVITSLALGALVAWVRLGLPVDPLASIDVERPVEVIAQVVGHWSAEDQEGWTTAIEVLRLVQADRVRSTRFAARLFVPGAEPPPPFGSMIRGQGYLRRSAPYANRLGTPQGPWRFAVESRLLLAIERGPGRLARLSAAVRGGVDRAYAAAGAQRKGNPSPGLAMARALVLGDASDIPDPWKRGLRRTGLAHLWSVSGLHLAMVAGLALLVSSRLRGGFRYLPTLAAIGGYLLLVGPLPPLVRAAAMAALAVLALSAERPPAPLNALALVVIVLVVHRPELARDLSFQLTASATAGLTVLAPRIERRWAWIFERRSRTRRILQPLVRALAASFGAEIATLPFTLPVFHLWAVAAPLWNLVAIPWTAIVLAASLAWTALALVSPPLAARAIPWLDGLAAPFGWPTKLPVDGWTSIPLAVGTLEAVALAIGLGGILLATRWRWRLAALGLLLLVLLPSLGALRVEQPSAPQDPEMTVFDVGQGDAILLRDGRRAVLVDGGGWRSGDFGGRVLLPALLGEGVRRLDAVISTHGDRDHCGGLVDIASYLPIHEVWLARSAEGSALAGCTADLAATPGVRVRSLAAGARAHVGRWRLRVLWPPRDSSIPEGNERSLVVRAEANGGSALLTGDIGERAEIGLFVEQEKEIDVDVLKVAHHGSGGSSLGLFLDAVKPRFAVVSSGLGNPYGHPAPEALARLRERTIDLLRTDRQGAIHLRFRPAGRIAIELPGEK